MLALLTLLSVLGGASESSRCFPLPVRESRNLEVCLESRKPEGSRREFAVAIRDASKLEDRGHHALAIETRLELAEEETLDHASGGAFDLPGGIVIWAPVVMGEPGHFLEGHLRLFLLDLKASTLRPLPNRLRCLRICEMQFLSYQSSRTSTTLLHEARTNAQTLRSTYRWDPKTRTISPLDIEEPKAREEITRGETLPPSKPVCERTRQVAEEIARRAGRKTCAEVTASDLSAITFLEMSGKGVASLAPGDFSGLPRLGRIELSSNPLEALPRGLFDGLFVLDSLNFQECKLTEIPDDTFLPLRSLKSLYLNANRIERLGPNAFRGLESLTFLALNNNRLASLPPGVFDPLKAKKKHVYLNGNPVQEMAP